MLVALFIALPILLVVASRASQPAASLPQQVVTGIAVYEALLLVTGLALGFMGGLRPDAYASVHAIGAFVAAAVSVVRRSHRAPATLPPAHVRAWLASGRGTTAGLLIAATTLLIGGQLAVDAWLGTRHADGLWYHIPRITLWAERGTFDALPTPAWPQVGHWVGADVVLGAKVFLGLGWAGASFVTAILTIGALGAVYLIAIDFRLGRWRAICAATLFASFPAVGARVSAMNSDIAASFPLLAGYALMERARDRSNGIAVLVLLTGLGLACKLTVAPFALLLWLCAGFRTRASLWELAWGRIGAAVLTSAVLIAGSAWPVYTAFGDFLGGPIGRAHAVSDPLTFLRAIAVSVANWAIEPLGYVPGWLRGPAFERVEDVYRTLGVRFDEDSLGVSARHWQPWPSPDSGRTGALALVAFPVVAWLLPVRARTYGLPLFIVGFVLVSGFTAVQPWAGRFTIILLAGYALAWAAIRPFARAPGRRWLGVLVAANLVAACSVSAYLSWRAVEQSRADGEWDYLTSSERDTLATRLSGAPLLVVSGGDSPDALLSGPKVRFATRYVTCPADGDWVNAFRQASMESSSIALVHMSESSLSPDNVLTPASQCSRVNVARLREALSRAKWTPLIARRKLEVWSTGYDVRRRLSADGEYLPHGVIIPRSTDPSSRGPSRDLRAEERIRTPR